MARPKKAPPRRRWYEHPLVQTVAIVTPIAMGLLVTFVWATKTERFDYANRARASAAEAKSAESAPAPAGMRSPSVRSVSAPAGGTSRNQAEPAVVIDPESTRAEARAIRTSGGFKPLSMDEYYRKQDRVRDLGPVEMEAYERTLIGSTVIWEGTVESVQRRRDGSAEVVLQNIEDVFDRAFLSFDRSARRELRGLRPSQRARISGRVENIAAWPFLTDCQLLATWSLEPHSGEQAEPDADADATPQELTQDQARRAESWEKLRELAGR